MKEVAIYGDKAKINLGPSGVLNALKRLATELQEKGYTEIVIQGLRYSGAKPGGTETLVIDIANFIAKK